MGDKERSADIAAGFVQPELGPRLARQLGEIVVGVVVFIPVEIIQRSVEVVGAGLDHHEDGPAGTDAVIGPVVAVESLEFGERIDRG